jgi:uncharacterized membrane protein
MTDMWTVLGMTALAVAGSLLALVLALRRTGHRLGALFRAVILPILVVGVIGVLVSCPYLLDFRTTEGEFIPLADSNTRSLHLIALFGPALLPIVLWLGRRADCHTAPFPRRLHARRLLPALMILTPWALFTALAPQTFSLITAILALALALLLAIGIPRHWTPLAAASALALGGLTLILLAELIVYDTGLPGPAIRMVSVFRLHHPAWLALALAVGLAWHRQPLRPIALLGVAAGLAAHPVGLAERMNRLSTPPTLDASEPWRHQRPDDWEAGRWLYDLEPWPLRICELGGFPHRGWAPLSTLSGHIALLSEEDKVLTRGVPPAHVRERWNAILRIYTSESLDEALDHLQSLEVDLLAVGANERAEFDERALAKFDPLPVLYRNESVTIWDLRDLPSSIPH